jgi:membrane protein
MGKGRGSPGHLRNFFSILKLLFSKYRKDNANIIVSSIAFYLLLTFIPFTLLAMSLLGFIFDLTDIDDHFIEYLRHVVPEPYNLSVVRVLAGQLNIIEMSRKFSGPLGLYFLFFFTARLFSVLIPGFRIIFRQKTEGFFKGKGKEFFFTALFALLQALIFFLTVFLLLIKSRVVGIISDYTFLEGPTILYLFSFVDGIVIFSMILLLYYLLSPARKETRLLMGSALIASLFWAGGKYLFKYYIIHVGRFDLLYGTYGIFIGFLLWIYYSVFVFVVCAELQSVLLKKPNRAPEPSSSPSRSSP